MWHAWLLLDLPANLHYLPCCTCPQFINKNHYYQCSGRPSSMLIMSNTFYLLQRILSWGFFFFFFESKLARIVPNCWGYGPHSGVVRGWWERGCVFIYLTCACRFWVLTLIINGINCRICHMFACLYPLPPLRTPLPHCTKSCIFKRFFHSFLIPSAMRTLPWVHTPLPPLPIPTRPCSSYSYLPPTHFATLFPCAATPPHFVFA